MIPVFWGQKKKAKPKELDERYVARAHELRIKRGVQDDEQSMYMCYIWSIRI
jgi:hypothetical protein